MHADAVSSSSLRESITLLTPQSPGEPGNAKVSGQRGEAQSLPHGLRHASVGVILSLSSRRLGRWSWQAE
jgi:hypothetical protein